MFKALRDLSPYASVDRSVDRWDIKIHVNSSAEMGTISDVDSGCGDVSYNACACIDLHEFVDLSVAF
jgi:hypothetical protein